MDSTSEQSNEEAFRTSSPSESVMRGEPLFGILLVLTPVLAIPAALKIGPNAGAMVALAMVVPLLIAGHIDDRPLSLYTTLEQTQAEREQND